jgi:hypothetical protein
MPKMPRIRITLQSDLCVASGEGFSSVIDVEPCYDKFGLPFIPTRRLKGCLRDAARLIYFDSTTTNADPPEDPPMVNTMFGESGSNSGGQITLSGAALLEDYETLRSELESSDQKILQMDVASLFTYTRAQTAVEQEAGAKSETLRLVRVVRQNSPFHAGEPLVFSVQCDLGEIEFDDFARICKATRNIGFNRTRGLGAIRCELLPDDTGDTGDTGDTSDTGDTKADATPPPLKEEALGLSLDELKDDAEYSFEMVLENTTPLILSAQNNDESINYINGSAVLGALAWRFIKTNPSGADDPLFSDIFLTDKVKFSNFYLSIKGSLSKTGAPEYHSTYPVPLCYTQLKKTDQENGQKTDEIINKARDAVDHENKQKSLADKTAYSPTKADSCAVWRKSDSLRLAEVKMETIYHFARPKAQQLDGTLYTQTAISAGQFFKGNITATGRHIKVLHSLILQQPVFRIGKSKTAQYAECKVVAPKIAAPIHQANDEPLAVENEQIAVWLKSDLLLLRDGIYTTNVDDLFCSLREHFEKGQNTVARLAKAEGVSAGSPAEQVNDASSFAFKTVTGFSGIWNLQKPHMKAFAAGSVLILKASGTFARRFFFGERQNEGFGLCEIMRVDEMPSIMCDNKTPSSRVVPSDAQECGAETASVANNDTAQTQAAGTSQIYAKIKRQKDLAAIKKEALDHAQQKEKGLKITLSQLGRVILMLEQADSWENFESRIKSIKTASCREEIKRYISDCKTDPRDSFENRRLFWELVFRIQRYRLKEKVQREAPQDNGEEATQ